MRIMPPPFVFCTNCRKWFDAFANCKQPDDERMTKWFDRIRRIKCNADYIDGEPLQGVCYPCQEAGCMASTIRRLQGG